MMWQQPGDNITLRDWVLQYTDNEGVLRAFWALVSPTHFVNDDELPAGKFFEYLKMPKGRGVGMKPMTQNDFFELADLTLSLKSVALGFDSCSTPKFELWAKDKGQEELLTYCDTCDSAMFSLYINVDGLAYPCSFAEGYPGIKPTDVLAGNDFLCHVWESPAISDFRRRNMGRTGCILYDL
jgi:MoaA/NifB/PqqE/SkfB family radical SAM enzyme